jgi:hypothetical protein
MPVPSAERDHAPLKLSLEKRSKVRDHAADSFVQKPNQAALDTKFGGQDQGSPNLNV